MQSRPNRENWGNSPYHSSSTTTVYTPADQPPKNTSFYDTFFSLQPYRNTSEAMAVIGASILAAIVVPLVIIIFEPLLLVATLAALLVSFVSSISYIYHALTGNQKYLEDNDDYYKNLYPVTMGLLWATHFPPVTWSIAILVVALGRGIASLYANSQTPVETENSPKF